MTTFTTVRPSPKAQIATLKRENDIYSLALADSVNGSMKWFTRFGFKLGISRPTAGCGGIAIVGISGMISAHYWEEYVREQSAHIDAVITGEDNERNRELLRIRSCIDEAKAWVRVQQLSL